MLDDQEMGDLHAGLFRAGWDEVDELLGEAHDQTREVIRAANHAATVPYATDQNDVERDGERRLQLLTSLALLQQSLLEHFMRRMLTAHIELPPGAE